MSITIAVVLAALALIIGITSNWIPKPKQLKVRWVVVILAVAAILMFVLTRVTADDEAGTKATPERTSTTSGGLTSPPPANEIPEEVRQRLVMTWDDSSGSPVLYSSRSDGTNRQRSGVDGSNIRLSFLPNSTDIVMSSYESSGDSQYLEIQSLSGEHIRRLTHPKAHFRDFGAYAIDYDSGMLYFLRERSTDVGEGTSTLKPYGLMRVPLDGSKPEQLVKTPIQLQSSISTSRDGAMLAGECFPEEGPSQICVTAPEAKSYVRLPGSMDSSMEGPSVSPDGRYIAYSSIKSNAYGESQVYVYDRETKATTMLTQLPGRNGDVTWFPDPNVRCLALSHYETSASVYFSCLQSRVGRSSTITLPGSKIGTC